MLERRPMLANSAQHGRAALDGLITKKGLAVRAKRLADHRVLRLVQAHTDSMLVPGYGLCVAWQGSFVVVVVVCDGATCRRTCSADLRTRPCRRSGRVGLALGQHHVDQQGQLVRNGGLGLTFGAAAAFESLTQEL